LGDVYQLPPIDSETDSITFSHTKATLNKAVRYSGPITDLGNRIRLEIDNFNNEENCTKFVLNEWMNELGEDGRTSRVNEEGSGYIFLNDIDKVIDISLDVFKNKTDPSDLKLLAYRNSNVKKLNDVIRAQLYQHKFGELEEDEEIPQFMENELVICDGGYQIKQDNSYISIIYNNETFKVVESKKVTGPFDIPCLSLKLNPQPKMPDNSEIYVLDWELGRHRYFDLINEERSKAKSSKNWSNYYKVKNSFCWFEYNYAQGSHQSQGRTYKNVIVFENDILSITKNTLKEKLQSLYVCCTRAQKLVFIYNKKYKVNQDEIPESIKKSLNL